MSLTNGANYNDIFFYCQTDITLSNNNSILYGNFISDFNINVIGNNIEGRLFTSTDNGDISINNININSIALCYCEGSLILIDDGNEIKYKTIVKTDKVVVYGIIGEHMNYKL